ncbi:MAG: DMT family transporter [Candidatus Atribacteria bacterium]|nr:MAG: DMT family transporter [Candidatus Atribacteria bacterium]
MLTAYQGELAGIATAFCWTVSYLLFTIAVRIAGPKWLNRWRLTVALLLLLVVHWAVYRTPLPFGADLGRWGWLTLSGVVGFAMSDAFLFRALLHLGAHRTSLVTSLIPVMSALLAWIIFDERLSLPQMLSAGAVVSGIALVISARPSSKETATRKEIMIGVLFALGTVVTQSLRYILSKQALGGEFPALSANVVQILAATLAVWIAAMFGGRWKQDLAVFRNRRAAFSMIGGAMAGPFIGVTLSMVALANAQIGIASILMALPPVLLLAFSYVVLKEKVTPRAVAGTAFAISGVACLFLI